MTEQEKTQILGTVRNWVEQVVIGLDLCPFAQRELLAERVRFVVSEATSERDLLMHARDELALLEENDTTETTLLIHPLVLTDFMAYNQFLDAVDAMLVDLDLEGVYQFASFHPDYQFAGTTPDDPENYTNRSPWPILHILREDSLEAAIAHYPDVAGIPDRNVARMHAMGTDALERLMQAVRISGT